MLKLIKELFSLLTPQQRKRFYFLQFLVVIMALIEMVGIASIGPFMALVGDIGLIERNEVFSQLYSISGLTDPMVFLFIVGLLVFSMLGFATLFSMYTIWKISVYAAQTGSEISDRLYTHYMQKNWMFHVSGSSAQLTKQISVEALRVTDLIIDPLMQMNARAVLALFISIAIFIYDPLVALAGLSVFVAAYIALFKIVRGSLQKNGTALSDVATVRFRLMNEGFGGIKDVLLLGRKQNFIKSFQDSGEIFAYARGTNNTLTQVPRYFMEFLAFGAMIALVLVLIKTNEGNLGKILPILAIYALAAFKLLPALQQVYANLARIKGNVSAFESIKSDLIGSMQSQVESLEEGKGQLTVSKQIDLKGVTFTYPGKAQAALSGLNLTIPVNNTIGIVGPSGSGKSTAIDLLLGLIPPDDGFLLVDGVAITEANKRAWQNSIGFVPQNIFLSEGSILENVAFGLAKEDINIDQVKKAVQLAHLDEFVEQMEDGLNTKVGERGVQLSGGQRQRIGIARALYNNADILVFDEATSALDGITEKLIMEAIHDFSGKKTIIMIAHRLKTVEKCDQIIFIDKGQLSDKGTYQELLLNNPKFASMAKHG
ncbi:MAG: ATP-binding cassette, subfamily B, bacterial PglK [Thiomicrorhabdus sp.]|nr:MAG: ATP-binding cassette, subfamily B, bacterial PglK [Thiomicrorhabdus sp.]